MTDGLLENIIQLEKKIQSEVAAELARATAWQERELSMLQRTLQEELSLIENSRKQHLEEKKAELLEQRAAMQEAAENWCQRLETLDDATLREVLKRHLAGVLPGGDHDHPHGEG